jgi:exodeoxyribonuclease X
MDQMQFDLHEKNEKKFLFFDTETTDILDKEIIQLAILKEDEDALNMYFKPKGQISYSAMAVHNITPEMVKNEPYFEDAVYEGKNLKEYLDNLNEKHVWVAHNIDFDNEVLEKVGVKISQKICTFKLARDLLSLDQKDEKDLPSYSLQYLRYYLGLYKDEDSENNRAHDALSDVCFLRDLFEYLVQTFELTTEKMINITQAPIIIRNIHHGKHAGKSIKEILKEDPGYLDWIIDNWDDKPDIVWNVKRVLNEEKTT